MSDAFRLGEQVLVDARDQGTVVSFAVVPGKVRVHLSAGGPGLLDLDVDACRLSAASVRDAHTVRTPESGA